MRLECLCPVLNESLTGTFLRPDTPFQVPMLSSMVEDTSFKFDWNFASHLISATCNVSQSSNFVDMKFSCITPIWC